MKTVPGQGTAVTCSGAHAPRGQAVGRGEAVEHADVLRRQELHELGVVKHFALAVQDGRRLVRDVNYFARDERDGYGENILRVERWHTDNKRRRRNWSVRCVYFSRRSKH